MRSVCQWCILLFMIVLAGCSSQDFGRPIGRIGDVVDSGKAYVADNRDEESMRRATQLAEILAEWERQKLAVDEDYTLGPDDVLTIGVLSLETPDVVTTLTRTISKDGTVALPLVGVLSCAGMTARGVQNRVTEAYRGNYLQNPQVDVAVSEYRSAPVVITGAVAQPGVYYLRHNQSSVLEVLSMAQGLSAEAGNDLLIVRRRDGQAAPNDAEASAQAAEGDAAVEDAIAALTNDGAASKPTPPEPWTGSRISEMVGAGLEEEAAYARAEEDAAAADRPRGLADSADNTAEPDPGRDAPAPVMGEAAMVDDGEAAMAGLDADLITVDLEQLLDEGDVRLNLPIVGGDIVTVPPGRREYVYVLGYVQRPGAFELGGRDRVRAMQAVAMAGGLSGAARAQNSFLIIDKPTGRKVVSIDLTKIARGQRPPVYMESGNTLVIGSGVFARLAEFIRPTISAGADLTPGP